MSYVTCYYEYKSDYKYVMYCIKNNMHCTMILVDNLSSCDYITSLLAMIFPDVLNDIIMEYAKPVIVFEIHFYTFNSFKIYYTGIFIARFSYGIVWKTPYILTSFSNFSKIDKNYSRYNYIVNMTRGWFNKLK